MEGMQLLLGRHGHSGGWPRRNQPIDQRTSRQAQTKRTTETNREDSQSGALAAAARQGRTDHER